MGLNNQFAGPGRAEATNDPSPLDAIREQTSKIEDWLTTIGEPMKPLVSPRRGVHLWARAGVPTVVPDKS